MADTAGTIRRMFGDLTAIYNGGWPERPAVDEPVIWVYAEAGEPPIPPMRDGDRCIQTTGVAAAVEEAIAATEAVDAAKRAHREPPQ